MGSGSSAGMSENEAFLHQFDDLGYEIQQNEFCCLDAVKPKLSFHILTATASSASLLEDEQTVNQAPQLDEDATHIEHFKDVDSPLKYEDFFMKIRSNTLSIEVAMAYFKEFPDALFATDCCGYSPVDYAHKNRNSALCVAMIQQKFLIAKQNVVLC